MLLPIVHRRTTQPSVHCYSLGIHCMNCEQVIQVDQIDRHSLACTLPSYIHNVADPEYFRFRLEKLVQFLSSYSGHLAPNDVRTKKQLEFILRNLLLTTPSDGQSTLDELAALSRRDISAFGLTVEIERARALVQNYIHSPRGTSSHRPVFQLPEIVSDVHSKVPESVYSLSATQEVERAEDVGSEDIVTNPKRHFYTLCLSVKARLPPDSPGQTVSVASLFELAAERRLLPDQWLAFIEASMSGARATFNRVVKKPRVQKHLFDTLITCI